MLSKSRLLRFIQDSQTISVALENIKTGIDNKVRDSITEKKVVKAIKRLDELSGQLKKSIAYHE